MGFQEMRGPLVETEFWDMDALYMPQFHPARAIHDVYFVKNPAHADKIPEPLLSRVAEAHENGSSMGSTGWGYEYDRERARRLILRSQGTAVSARTLAANPLIPGKYFSIARCFRYDQVDATHATINNTLTMPASSTLNLLGTLITGLISTTNQLIINPGSLLISPNAGLTLNTTTFLNGSLFIQDENTPTQHGALLVLAQFHRSMKRMTPILSHLPVFPTRLLLMNPTKKHRLR